jgi:AcrR family transcriptional regulator
VSVATDERDATALSLRDRKRERTRRALIAAAAELFERKGYDETTVAEIAAEAEIGTRTFFSYFASKEEILFPESDARVRATIDAIAHRDPVDGPADVLLRALETVAESDTDIVGPMAVVRMRLFWTVSAVRGRALQVQLAAQQEIARELHAAFPDELDRVSAATLVGALTGAVNGALVALMDTEDGVDATALDAADMRAQVWRATELALRPWRQTNGPESPPNDGAEP